MIDPNVPPPLPPQVVAQIVYRGDGTPLQVVTVAQAAQLAGWKVSTVERHIAEGRITICFTPEREKRVVVESLWMAFPIEMRR